MKNPCFRLRSIVLAALTMSVGWGIRGNFGHEYGAMFAGAIATLAVVLVAGRDDWVRRAPYFALFGAIGWGFGGSMSYGQVLGYTHSGHVPSEAYGFACLFVIGFLWAGLGGAAAAIPAVLDSRRLALFFRPLSLVLAVWSVLHFALPWVHETIQAYQGANRRHEGALYWLDSDWVSVACILAAILVYDLAQRRFSKSPELVVYVLAGSAGGWLLALGLELTGLAPILVDAFVRHYGDLATYSRDELVSNWPNFFAWIPEHLGWAAGGIAGIGVYFARHGKFRHGAGLLLHLALGWFVGFLLLPVLLDLRMTPPRGDNWAGVLGVWIGAMVFCLRRGYSSIAYASLVGGTIGGIGFAGAAWVQILGKTLGNPVLAADAIAAGGPEGEAAAAWVASWRHWQSANWHSILEQVYGAVNGIAVLAALGVLVGKTPPRTEVGSAPRWPAVLCVFFAGPMLGYANLEKNLGDWTREVAPGFRPIPLNLTAPLFEFDLSARAWFALFWWSASLVAFIILARHLRRPLPVFAVRPEARAQLLYLAIVWLFVLGNAAKQLPAFGEGRLVTEGVIFLSACAATLLLVCGKNSSAPPPRAPRDGELRARVRGWAVIASIALVAVTLGAATSVRAIYGDKPVGFRGPDIRFGPESNAVRRPLLRGVDHR